jgi:glutamate racemase
MSAQPIGVFDSGIGGLTVVRSLLRELPHENIVYFGDTARVPYGSKSPQVVREYAAQDVDVLAEHKVKLVVVACNTVSAVALDVVQKRAKVPVIGVILPGAASAASATERRRIGIIGTVATVNSGAYANAIRAIDPGVQVFARACPLFVPLAEEGWIDHQATTLIAKVPAPTGPPGSPRSKSPAPLRRAASRRPEPRRRGSTRIRIGHR